MIAVELLGRPLVDGCCTVEERMAAGRFLCFWGATGVLVTGFAQVLNLAGGEKSTGCPSAYEPVRMEWSAALGDIIDAPSEDFGLFSKRLM